MRAKKPFFIALFLCSWSIISYFLLIRQTDTNHDVRRTSMKLNEVRRQREDILKQLNRLETNIYEENELHDELVKKLIEIVRLKDQQNGVGDGVGQSVSKQNQHQKPNHNNRPDTNDKYTLNGNVVNINNNNNNNNNDIIDNDDNINKINSLDTINGAEIGSEQQQQQQPILTNEDDIQAQLIENLRKLNGPHDGQKGPTIAVLVFACNRISVRNCLDDLVKYRPKSQSKQFPIIVTQDCNDEPTKNVIESYKEVTFMRQPDQSDIFVLPKDKKFKGYYKIARHYGWALNTTFKAGFEYVIIVEDDLNVSPDFYEYFLGTHELLKNDSSLWCVSAWNDNGKNSNIDMSNPGLLYRTDFFPGLGWMLKQDLWNELSIKWPKAFWDDWIRQPQQRKDRACIRPEISRTRTFGKIGVSNGMFFDKHLKFIKLNEKLVEFTKLNLTYLLKSNYDKQFINHVYSCPVVTFEEIRRGLVTTKNPVRIQYNTKDQYKRTAKLLGLMDDFKSGVPRTGYLGIVSFFYNNQRVYLAPNNNWKGYDLSWS